MEIKLVSQDQTAEVHRATIPDFKPPPDVIGWGDRVFKRVGFDGPVTVYAECFAYALVP